eukprot:SM000030S11458  [mRNA]  locus=s30:679237:681832:- [translate_table: standard]
MDQPPPPVRCAWPAFGTRVMTGTQHLNLGHTSTGSVVLRGTEGRRGSLVDESGRFYKPLQGGERGDQETSFYEKIQADESVPKNILAYFPRNLMEAFAIAALRYSHAVLEDLTHGFKHPSVADIKAFLWPLIKEKDASTTSGELGFRLGGMQVYDERQGTTWRADRKWCKNIKSSEMHSVLLRFVSSNCSQDEAPFDGKHANEVYVEAVAKLQELKSWFEVQQSYQFYSASVLFIYEGGDLKAEGGMDSTAEQARKLSTRLVDFAHVTYNNQKDENFLHALQALIALLSLLITSA